MNNVIPYTGRAIGTVRCNSLGMGRVLVRCGAWGSATPTGVDSEG